jgi:hypothetical protein
VATIEFPNPNDLTTFKVFITPDTGYWNGATYEFQLDVPALYVSEIGIVYLEFFAFLGDGCKFLLWFVFETSQHHGHFFHFFTNLDSLMNHPKSLARIEFIIQT